jgi:hypothetical protein
LFGLWTTGHLPDPNKLPHKGALLATIAQNANVLRNHRSRGYLLTAKAICKLIEVLCQLRMDISGEQAGIKNIIDKNKKKYPKNF